MAEAKEMTHHILRHFVKMECNCEYCKMYKKRRISIDKYGKDQMMPPVPGLYPIPGTFMPPPMPGAYPIPGTSPLVGQFGPNIPTVLNTGPQSPAQVLNRPLPKGPYG